jgi:hypothetical protein
MTTSIEVTKSRSAQLGVVILQVAQIVRDAGRQAAGLGSDERDREREEADEDAERHHENHEQCGPPWESSTIKRDYSWIESNRQLERKIRFIRGALIFSTRTRPRQTRICQVRRRALPCDARSGRISPLTD